MKQGAMPDVWLLLGHRDGDNAQVAGLGDSLGWPLETKQLVFNRLHLLPNHILGRTTASLSRDTVRSLQPPWPNLVVGCGKRSVPAARWIQAQSGGRTRIVYLGRPWAPIAWFDLVVMSLQYRFAIDAPNLLQCIGPIHGVTPHSLAVAGNAWLPRFKALPRPWIAVLAGGSSAPYLLDPHSAAKLGRIASARAKALSGSLLVTTSRRTRPAAVEALFAAISVPAHLHRWQAATETNPYLGMLALADQMIVTGDSASMLMESCATRKPVTIFDLPRRRSPLLALGDAAGRRLADRAAANGTAGSSDPIRRMLRCFMALGIFSPARDMDELHRALIDRGMASKTGAIAAGEPGPPVDDRGRLLARIVQLLEQRQVEPSSGAVKSGAR